MGRDSERHGPRRVFFLVLATFAAGLLALPAGAGAYSFGPTVTGLGLEEMVFDHSAPPPSGACEEWDIPDQPARAFRDDQGRVQLYFSAFPVRANVGPDLNTASTLGHHDCTVRLASQQDSDPGHYDDFSWLAAPYTLDGQTIYSLVHQEYRAWLYGCSIPSGGDTTACWYNSINLATSTNSGDLFTHAAQPAHLVASVPDNWLSPTGPYGVFQPSNIIAKDGYYYSMVRWKNPGEFDSSCLMRTRSLSDPTSWRGWGGSGFNVRFINPYLETPANRLDHVCAPLAPSILGGASESLTYNTYLGKYMMVGGYAGTTPGFYYSLSDDLIHWTDRQLLIARETHQSYACGDEDPVRDPAVLDPASTSRNFETAGRDVYVYYKIMHTAGCSFPADRDVLRVPVRFNGTVPVASFTSSASPGLIGTAVTFDASGSSDPGASPITKYEWDFNGDGYFETNSGSNPQTTRTFWNVESGKVALRVTDSEGFQDIVEKRWDADGRVNMQPNAVATPSTYVKEIGTAYNDVRGYGWVREDSLGNATHTPLDLSANTVDRDKSDVDGYDQRLDTLLFMQYPAGGSRKKMDPTPGGWEMAVPCGVYTVTVTAGDSRYRPNSRDPGDSSINQVNVEGQAAISGFVPTSANRFQTVTKTVPVCDGKLTIDAIGGTNTKLDYIDVTRADPAKVNFQPASQPVPGGYARDTGAPYNDVRGYGWVREDSLSGDHVPLDLSANTRDRDYEDTDPFAQDLDTFLFMQYPPGGFIRTVSRTPGAWEMTLPCGTYTVTVSAGDSRYRAGSADPGETSIHQVNAEGQPLISAFQPTDANRFQSAVQTLPVCDGRLTLDAIGGTNTKINYVEVRPVSLGL